MSDNEVPDVTLGDAEEIRRTVYGELLDTNQEILKAHRTAAQELLELRNAYIEQIEKVDELIGHHIMAARIVAQISGDAILTEWNMELEPYEEPYDPDEIEDDPEEESV